MGLVQLGAVLCFALAQAGAITATPDHAVAASSEPLKLELAVTPPPPAGTAVRFDSFGVGTPGPAKEVAPGRFEATYQAPKERYPQVAILRAELTEPSGQRRNVWGRVPVWGVQTLKLTTKPNAEVDVQIGPLRFPASTRADAAGRVEVPVQVPPGIDVARVRSVDRLGNRTDKPVPLDPPEVVRVRIAPAAGEPAASFADAQPLALELHAVARDGGPVPPGAQLIAELEPKDRGALEPLKPVRPGLWTTRYRAPRAVGDGKVQVRARLKERGVTKAFVLQLALKPGPPARIDLRAAEVLRADSPRLPIGAVAFDAEDNPIGPPEQVTADFGQVKPSAEGFVLEAPQVFGARDQVTITARSGAVTQTLLVKLRPGVAATGTVRFASEKVRAGAAPARGVVELRDARGNPVAGATLRFASAAGEGKVERELGQGRYEVRFDAPRDAAVGPTALEISVEESALRLRAPLVVLPSLRAGSMSVGIWGGGRSNLNLVHGAGAAAEYAVYPAALPLEVTVSLGFATFARIGPESRPLVDLRADRDDPARAVSVRMSSLQLLAGARYHLALGAATTLHAGGAVGLHRVGHYVNAGAVGVDEDSSSWSPLGRLAAGVMREVGPGRLGVELGYGLERFSWDPADDPDAVGPEKNLPRISGNLGGLQLQVGYLFRFR